MTTRGKVAAAALVVGAVVATVVLLWTAGKDTSAAPTHKQTSEQIKASAQAYENASLLDGRKAQLAILNLEETPSEELCKPLWDRKTTTEQHAMDPYMWMTGCVEAPAP